MKTLGLCSALLVVFATGCADLRDGIDDSVVSIKARTAAATAWSDSTALFGGIDDETHFADGFKAGYFNATKYGPASRSRMPRRYSGSAFRSRRGQQRIQAWIDGFEHGTSIAMEEMTSEGERKYELVGYEERTSKAVTIEVEGSRLPETASGAPERQQPGSGPTVPATAND